MTALSANAARKLRNIKSKAYGHYVVNSGSEIYQGALVAFEASGDEIIPAADTVGLRIAGIATERVTGDGTLTCKVIWDVEALFACNAAVTAADVGTTLVVEDDNTVSDAGTETNDIPVGRMTELASSTTAWVHVMQGAVA